MEFLACIQPLLSCICEPVMSAAQNFLATEAQRCITSLRNWFVGRVNPPVNPPVSPRTADFEEVPGSATAIVGAEETLADILAHLNDDSVGIIGIYGMGGAGKTSLLRKINNDLYESRTAQGKFDLGIWVTVSKEVSIPEIRKQIARRLRLTLSDDESQHAWTLFRALSQTRFLMLLDDLWTKLDLVTVGIPVPTNGRKCKIAFTTRLLNVCTDMDAKSVEVKPLGDGPSWELFCSKVGTEVDLDNSRMYQLAKQVVRKCGGLPLALITVGRAMANRRGPGEWVLAVKDLDRSAEKLRGMDQVLSSLKLSYDYLENDKMRSALLYCAMYPEDRAIRRDELIEHWIGEGMLDDDDDVDDARNRGHGLITDLQHSCLLEAGIHDVEICVRMHDAVRDLALWLNRTSCDKVDGFMAGEDLIMGANTQRLEHTQRLKHVRRIWMRNFSVSPPCVQNWPPNSWTLLLNESHVEPCLLQGIFNCMRTLRVLDLSHAQLPEELPFEIHFLQDLQYLNLTDTRIRSLPKELGNLVKLRHLYLTSTTKLTRIPREAIVGLSSLQVLHMMMFSGYKWRSQDETPAVEDRMVDDEENKQHSSSDTGAAEEGSGGRQLEVSDLEGLQRLQELVISLNSPHALQQLSRSESLRRRTRVLEVRWKYQGGDGPLRMTLTQRFDQLKELKLFGDRAHHSWVGDLRISRDLLPCLERLFVSSFNCETTSSIVLEGERFQGERFHELVVQYSSGWKELELVGKFPGLEEIRVRNCDGMEELLLDEDNEGTGSQQHTLQEQLNDSRFPKLKELVLSGLRDLKSIGRRPLFLPKLELIRVLSCPQLRRLPLGPGSAPKLEDLVVIECDGMEELLLDEENEGTGSQQDTIQEQLNDGHFLKLKTILLLKLRNLKSISRRPLFLPSIELMVVQTTPQLRRLPLGRGSAPKLKKILGEQEWWDGLEWGDDANIRNVFAPFFSPY